MQIVARRFDNRQPVRLVIADRCIESATQLDESAANPRLPLAAPGWIDLQVNGYNGQEFSSLELTPEKVLEIVRRHFAFGVTSLCPTLTTQSFDCLVHGMQTIDFACRTFPHAGKAVAGIHLEGPYFDSNDGPRGASRKSTVDGPPGKNSNICSKRPPAASACLPCRLISRKRLISSVGSRRAE